MKVPRTLAMEAMASESTIPAARHPHLVRLLVISAEVVEHPKGAERVDLVVGEGSTS